MPHPSPVNQFVLFANSVWIALPGIMLLQNSERFFPSDGSAQSRSDPRIWPLLIVYCHLLASAFSFNLWWDFDTKSHRVWIDRTFAVLVLICALITSFYSGGFVFSASTCLCAVVLYFFGSRHFERRKSWNKELLTHLSFRGMVGLAVLNSHFFSPWELTPAEVGASALRALGFVLPHLLASYLYIVLVLKRLKRGHVRVVQVRNHRMAWSTTSSGLWRLSCTYTAQIFLSKL